MGCSSCQAELPDAARFCPTCGAPVSAPACASCGATLVHGARFCMSCGAPQAPDPLSSGIAPPVAARRTTSVLFADLVGFTSLSEVRDQEEVRELLERYFAECRRIVTRYGGVVEKFIGDAVMAVWGVPTAHEDDAERAVRAGLELVAAVAEFGEDVGAPGLALRVGIVTGEVAVTLGATQQGMVAGDAVNTAARVQAAASAGQVWVDDATRLLTTAAIRYADVGAHPMKGKVDPVRLWSVIAVVAVVGGAQRADGLEAPLVGRDRELRLVKELFHQCEESGRPVLLVVDGEAGVGKTRLAWEFEKYIDGLRSTVRWHSGRCLAYGEGVAYFALAEAVRGRLQVLAADDEDAADPTRLADLLDRGLDHYVADPGERPWLRERLGVLLGTGSPAAFPREDLFLAWVTFFERVGGGDPVALVVDDAQYADEGLLEFLEHLLTTASYACFVLVLTRPGLLEGRPALATHRRANVVHLPVLGDRDMARMLDGLVADLPAGVRAGLVSRAEGIPLYAVETVRSLIDRDLVVPREGRYVLSDADGLDLESVSPPASLHAVISARLDTLSHDQRTVIDRASVLGTTFDAATVTALCGDLAEPSRTLAELVRMQLLSQDSSRMSAEFGHYGFVQSAYRQAAYGSLARRDRKALHLAVLAQLEAAGNVPAGDETAAIRAQHYLDAFHAVPGDADADVLRAGALDNLRRAAARARGLGSPGEAARHLAIALPLAVEPALRGRVGWELAEAEVDAGLADAAAAHALEAEELLTSLGDRIGAGRAAAVRAHAVMEGTGNNEQALAVAEPWWEEVRNLPEAAETAIALSRVVASARLRLGWAIHDVVDARLRLAERLGATGALADAYSTLAVYYGGIGASSLTAVLLEAAADLARRHHDLDALARSLVNLTALGVHRNLERAVSSGKEAVEVATRAGNRFMVSIARDNLALALWWSGDWSAIDGLVDDDDRDAQDKAIEVALPCCGSLLAIARGDEADRFPWIARDDGDDRVLVAWRHLHRSTEALRVGESEAAVTLAVEAAEQVHRYSGVWDDFPLFWSEAVMRALRADDRLAVDRALGVLGLATDRHFPLGLQAVEAHVSGLLAIRDDGPSEAVEESLQRAIERYTTWGAVPSRARAQADLGRWLVTEGRPEEGLALVERARTTYAELGAHGWLADLETGLTAATGASIRHPSYRPEEHS